MVSLNWISCVKTCLCLSWYFICVFSLVSTGLVLYKHQFLLTLQSYMWHHCNLIFQIVDSVDFIWQILCQEDVYIAPCCSFLPQSLTTVWSNTYCSINPVLSIPAAVMACPKLPKSLIRGEFTSSRCKTVGSAMGPYFLFITDNWRWADSSKSFSGTIDQQWAICLSFLVGDINVALCLLKSPVTKNIQIGRVQEFD